MSSSHVSGDNKSFVGGLKCSDIPRTNLAQESEMSTCTQMSTCTDESMTNHHSPRLFAEMAGVLHVWRKRILQRRELTEWTERDMRDAGLSRGEVLYEASKPFWRA